MSSRPRRLALLSALVLAIGAAVGVSLAAAQTDGDEPAGSGAGVEPSPAEPGAPAPAPADPVPSEPAEPELIAPPVDEEKACRGGRLEAAAEYLEMEPDELRAQLAEGESLASIAEATAGKSVDGLRAAMLAALDERLEDAERLTDEEKAMLRERLAARVDQLIEREGLPEKGRHGHGHRGHKGSRGGGPHGHHGGARLGLDLGEAASSYLGLDRETLHEQRREGKSLAQIAEETAGKTAEGLTQALLAAAEEALEASDLDAEDRAAALERLEEQIPLLVEAEPGSRGRHFGHGGRKGLAPPLEGGEESGSGTGLSPGGNQSGASILL